MLCYQELVSTGMSDIVTTQELKVEEETTMHSKLGSLIKPLMEDDEPTPKPMFPSHRTMYLKTEDSDNCSSTPMLVPKETTEHSICTQASEVNNVEVSDVNLSVGLNSLRTDPQNSKAMEEATIVSKLGSFGKPIIEYDKVYQRKNGSKCLSTCRKLGLNFKDINRKKRKLRVKKSMKALKQLEGYTKFVILRDVLDRIAILRGKRKMLLPMKVNVVPEFFECVLSLISSSVKLRERRRSTKRCARVKNVFKETIDEDEMKLFKQD